MSDIVVLFMTIAIILAVINLIYVAGSFFLDRRVKDKSEEDKKVEATPVTDAATGFSCRSVSGNDKLIINPKDTIIKTNKNILFSFNSKIRNKQNTIVNIKKTKNTLCPKSMYKYDKYFFTLERHPKTISDAPNIPVEA